MGLVCAQVLLAHEPANTLEASTTGPGTAQGVRTESNLSHGEPSHPRVILWGHDVNEVASLARTRQSDRLPGFTLALDVEVTDDLGRVVDADVIVSAIPVQHMRAVWSRVRGSVGARGASLGVVSVAKGIENDTLLRPSQVLADALSQRDAAHASPRFAVLSGPTIAPELARCLPAAMIAASTDPAFAKQVQAMFSNSWLRVYTNPDVLGVELAGAAKNVIAIAAGICDGLQAGNNAKSALLARGLAEIVRLGVALGARPDTFFGIAGVGDLATTCFSPEGRNRSCGEALGRGRTLQEFLAGTTSVVEGVATTRGVRELARRHGVEMPIVEAVHAVLFEDQDPIDAIAGLMSRVQKAERVG